MIYHIRYKSVIKLIFRATNEAFPPCNGIFLPAAQCGATIILHAHEHTSTHPTPECTAHITAVQQYTKGHTSHGTRHHG